jgi:hypothetical protein
MLHHPFEQFKLALPENYNAESLPMHLYSSPHTTAADFSFLQAAVESRAYQVYVPEADGHTNEFVKLVIDVSRGNNKAYTSIMGRTDPNSSFYSQFRALYASRLNIFIADVPAELHQADPDMKDYGSMEIVDTAETIDSHLVAVRQKMERAARMIQKRDTHMATRLVTELPAYVAQHPGLRNRERVGILLTLGDNHVVLPRLLEAAGVVLTNTRMSPVMHAQEEAMQDLALGKEITDRQLIEATATSLMRNLVEHDSTAFARIAVRKITDGISVEDIERYLASKDLADMHDFVRERLKAAGYQDDALRFVGHIHPFMKQAIKPRAKIRVLGDGICTVKHQLF